jgi:peptide-methionine (R)-S-oxide reductase
MSVNSQEEKFKKKLTSEQYRILRQKGTEAPFTGDLLHNKDSGMYKCAACGADLFSSQHKFDSGTGWPSFYDVAQSGAVKLEEDSSLGMSRVEAVCTNCGSHLGHVFEDGPSDKTGKRYCINSVCLAFDPKNRQD